jgi:hypothetical protein
MSESLLEINVCDFDTPAGTNTWRCESKKRELDKERFYVSLEKEVRPCGWSCVRDTAWETSQPCWGLRLSLSPLLTTTLAIPTPANKDIENINVATAVWSSSRNPSILDSCHGCPTSKYSTTPDDIHLEVSHPRRHQINITRTTNLPSKQGSISCLFMCYLCRMGIVVKASLCFTIYSFIDHTLAAAW